jgi:hypothetical protein
LHNTAKRLYTELGDNQMPAGSTYTPLATTTVSGTSTSSITFSSISQAYTDLILVCNGGMISGGADDNKTTFNGDTGTNYSRTLLFGGFSGAQSFRNSNQAYIAAPYWSSAYANQTTFHIMNYSNSTTNKTVLMRSDNPNEATVAGVFLWRSTAAINSITITRASTVNFASGSTFTLYGLAAA